MHWTRHSCTLVPTFMAILWLALFVFSRLIMLHQEYQNELNRLSDDEWLRVKCKDPEFFHNIKQHTDLCLKVEANARRSCLMVALNTVISTTYLCGYKSCAEYAQDLLGFFMTLSLPILGLIVLILFMGPTILYPMYSSYLNRIADRRVMALYNAPYGMPHYVDTHKALRYPGIEEVGDISVDMKKFM